ncbi:hypothetical protein [Roseovarius confluentis]|uniref:hypothetical protein n=1 Tax=Roseovarius confluentis TaxID=1852027 RepID=UPI000CDE17E9|nr:hypothetical protein [Roseovarius confluentis]
MDWDNPPAFVAQGIDDGKNRFTLKVLSAIWNALKAHDIEIPFPQLVVHDMGLGTATPTRA